MLTDPKDYAKKVLECAYGDYHVALRIMFDGVGSYPLIPSRFWADTVIELNALCDWVKRT